MTSFDRAYVSCFPCCYRSNVSNYENDVKKTTQDNLLKREINGKNTNTNLTKKTINLTIDVKLANRTNTHKYSTIYVNNNKYVAKKHMSKCMLGNIYIVKNTNTGKKFVLKYLRPSLSLTEGENSVGEIKCLHIMKKVNSNTRGYGNIAHVVEYEYHNDNMCIIMNYAKCGDLYHYITRHGAFHGDDVKIVFLQLLHGVHFLHAIGYCHRDISPENCLIFCDKNILTLKLADFGRARKNTMLQTSVDGGYGKTLYTAPEIFSNATYNGQVADVWALGKIFFIIMTGNTIFKYAVTSDKQYNYFLNHGIRSLIAQYEIKNIFDDDAIDLIEKMLCIDPNKRANICDLCDHKFFHDISNGENI